MSKSLLLAAAAWLSIAGLAVGDEQPRATENKPEPSKATFLITGLHCTACTKTVEASLSRVKGVRSIKVDWDSKNAKLEFDESVVTSQKLAQLIAATPHMMGGNLHYDGWLVLRAPEIKDDASAKRAQEALKKVEGVTAVAPYPAQHAVGVQFGPKGSVTAKQLIDVLKPAGFTATL